MQKPVERFTLIMTAFLWTMPLCCPPTFAEPIEQNDCFSALSLADRKALLAMTQKIDLIGRRLAQEKDTRLASLEREFDQMVQSPGVSLLLKEHSRIVPALLTHLRTQKMRRITDAIQDDKNGLMSRFRAFEKAKSRLNQALINPDGTLKVYSEHWNYLFYTSQLTAQSAIIQEGGGKVESTKQGLLSAIGNTEPLDPETKKNLSLLVLSSANEAHAEAGTAAVMNEKVLSNQFKMFALEAGGMALAPLGGAAVSAAATKLTTTAGRFALQTLSAGVLGGAGAAINAQLQDQFKLNQNLYVSDACTLAKRESEANLIGAFKNGYLMGIAAGGVFGVLTKAAPGATLLASTSASLGLSEIQNVADKKLAEDQKCAAQTASASAAALQAQAERLKEVGDYAQAQTIEFKALSQKVAAETSARDAEETQALAKISRNLALTGAALGLNGSRTLVTSSRAGISHVAGADNVKVARQPDAGPNSKPDIEINFTGSNRTNEGVSAWAFDDTAFVPPPTQGPKSMRAFLVSKLGTKKLPPDVKPENFHFVEETPGSGKWTLINTDGVSHDILAQLVPVKLDSAGNKGAVRFLAGNDEKTTGVFIKESDKYMPKGPENEGTVQIMARFNSLSIKMHPDADSVIVERLGSKFPSHRAMEFALVANSKTGVATFEAMGRDAQTRFLPEIISRRDSHIADAELMGTIGNAEAQAAEQVMVDHFNRLINLHGAQP